MVYILLCVYTPVRWDNLGGLCNDGLKGEDIGSVKLLILIFRFSQLGWRVCVPTNGSSA